VLKENTWESVADKTAVDAGGDFSLVLGGPLFQLLRRAHLSGSALELVRLRIIAAVALVWVPPLVLSVAGGHAWSTANGIPFLRDLEANLRCLLALPLLIGAELVVHERMRLIVRQFRDRHLIPDDEAPAFDAAIASAYRLRNSVPAEVGLIALVYAVGVLVFWQHYVAFPSASWHTEPADGGSKLSMAGVWYTYVSLPIFQFLLVRWYYRLFIWARFLWLASRIHLSLIPTHPDRVGGLGFLSNVVFAFTPIAMAHGVMLAGPIGNRIFYAGARLPDFKVEIVLIVVFLLCLMLGPFLVFSLQLAATKRRGLREYGGLAERYVRDFDTKWLRGGAPADEPLIGSADIQSLADLANSFEVVKSMKLAPVTRDALVRLIGVTLVPVVPLGLTMMSPEELLRKLLGLIF
jgi:hypothetical protein